MAKLVYTLNRDEAEGKKTPRFYGVAYVKMNTYEVTYAIIPFNVLIFWYKKIRHYLKTYGARDITKIINGQKEKKE